MEDVKKLKEEIKLFISEVCEEDGDYPLLTYLDSGQVLDIEDISHRTIEILERIEKLSKHLDELEANEKNKIASTLFGALIGTCKVKDILRGLNKT